MPSQMTLPQHVETLRRMGVSLDAASLSDPLAAPLAAVVSLGNCTGSFVSGDGLIVTNHHCVQRALQLNATTAHNLVEEGMRAQTRADERSAGPAQRVLVAQAFKDVTREMRDGLEGIRNPVARDDACQRRSKRLVAACEKDRPGIRCDVRSFFRRATYQLIESLEIRDVRLVYAPARAVGNYGGELDNWRWPRHTGDWAFLRAYVGKDGKPADFSADNVPFQPKHWLRVTTVGLLPGDFVMVAGYPGRTSRGVTGSEVHFDVTARIPDNIAYLRERYAIAEAHLKDAGETAIKAGLAKQGFQNVLAKLEGVLAGVAKGDLLARKDAVDAAIGKWAAEPGHEAQRRAIDSLQSILRDEQRTARADTARQNAFAASRLMSTALSLVRWAEQRAKADADRKAGFQARDLPRAIDAQRSLAKQYDRTLDRAELRLAMVRALKLPRADRAWLPVLLGVSAAAAPTEALIDQTLDAWYEAQRIEDAGVRLELLEHGTTATLRASKDPFVKAALRVWPLYKAEEKRSDAREGDLMLATPAYAQAMREVEGGLVAPDANGTLRISYGTVRSFHPESTMIGDSPFTVASQIGAKNTGKAPYNAPPRLLEAIKARRFGPYAAPSLGGDLPIDFLSDLDITGGNSGSPVLDQRGQLVGLAFDGTLDGVSSDVVFNGATTRTIQVDARYMLWTMDALDGADDLVREMGLSPAIAVH